jgi:hypothetical protein
MEPNDDDLTRLYNHCPMSLETDGIPPEQFRDLASDTAGDLFWLRFDWLFPPLEFSFLFVCG